VDRAVAATEAFDQYLGGPLALLLAGGALYTIGGVIYALQRPNPWPRIFGYLRDLPRLCCGGQRLHYTVIALYVVQ
jgi:hemolysin III